MCESDAVDLYVYTDGSAVGGVRCDGAGIVVTRRDVNGLEVVVRMSRRRTKSRVNALLLCCMVWPPGPFVVERY